MDPNGNNSQRRDAATQSISDFNRQEASEASHPLRWNEGSFQQQQQLTQQPGYHPYPITGNASYTVQQNKQNFAVANFADGGNQNDAAQVPFSTDNRQQAPPSQPLRWSEANPHQCQQIPQQPGYHPHPMPGNANYTTQQNDQYLEGINSTQHSQHSVPVSGDLYPVLHAGYYPYVVAQSPFSNSGAFCILPLCQHPQFQSIQQSNPMNFQAQAQLSHNYVPQYHHQPVQVQPDRNCQFPIQQGAEQEPQITQRPTSSSKLLQVDRTSYGFNTSTDESTENSDPRIDNISENECVMCNFLSSSSTQLVEHISSYHGYCYFKCKLCGETYRSKDNFARHIQRHKPGDTQFVCDICPATFSSKRSLYQHIRSLHPELYKLHDKTTRKQNHSQNKNKQ